MHFRAKFRQCKRNLTSSISSKTYCKIALRIRVCKHCDLRCRTPRSKLMPDEHFDLNPFVPNYIKHPVIKFTRWLKTAKSSCEHVNPSLTFGIKTVGTNSDRNRLD
jgi:hypothetical protein